MLPTEAHDSLRLCQTIVEDCANVEQDLLSARPDTMKYSTTSQDMEINIEELYKANDELTSIAEQCLEMDVYDYNLIKSDIVRVVILLKNVISR